MIVSVSGYVEFSNGIRLNIDFRPLEGITAVVGKNGAGKSFTASESVRYLLFGTKALRSTLATVKDINLAGVLKINNIPYRILRTKDRAILWFEDTQLAVGSLEVTNKVTELLGYGLDVFDLCNAAVQKKTTALGDMRPAERKTLIDRLTGMEQLIKLEKELKEEARSSNEKAVAYTEALPSQQPEPVMPNGYAPASDVRADLSELRSNRNTRETLQKMLKPVVEPEEPQMVRPNADLVAELQRHEQTRDQVINNIETLEIDAQSDKDIDHIWIEEDADHAVTVFKIRSRLPFPTLSRDEFREESIRQVNSQTSFVECPKCDHKFQPALTVKPQMDSLRFKDEEAAQKRWALHEWEDLEEPSSSEPALSPEDHRQVLKDIETKQLAATARQALSVIDVPKDRSQELTDTVYANAQWEAYDKMEAEAVEQRKLNKDTEEALRQYPEVDNAKVEALVDLVAKCEAYEEAHQHWKREQNHRIDLLSKIAEAQERSVNFKEGSDAMKRARLRLKAMLAPAISAEATNLIFDMTNGVLSSVYVDEDMTVTVDGQLLETLSGGGATVANIALRIALGRALVGNKFPVFIGDEMDGDLDEERREATIQALVSLKEHLQQIVLITHKDVSVADHTIRIGAA